MDVSVDVGVVKLLVFVEMADDGWAGITGLGKELVLVVTVTGDSFGRS